MNECLFCKIINNQIPAQKVFENEEVCAFKDINPQAPIHILIVPKTHISRVENLSNSDTDVIGKTLYYASVIAKEQGLNSGYRLVINNGEDGLQTVEHIHIHLLGGKKLGWPPC